MLKLRIVNHRSRAPPEWRVTVVLAWTTAYCWQEFDEEERGLEVMSHWRDPIERLRSERRRRHTLIDDNPASG